MQSKRGYSSQPGKGTPMRPVSLVMSWKGLLIAIVCCFLLTVMLLNSHVSSNSDFAGYYEDIKSFSKTELEIGAHLLEDLSANAEILTGHRETITNENENENEEEPEPEEEKESKITTVNSNTNTKRKSMSSKPERIVPIKGNIPTNGAVPLYGKKHAGGDAIFALACNYPVRYYERFVGSLRKAGYEGDIVLAVSPPEKMKPGVEEYVKKMDVIAYGFDVDCEGKDNCKLQDEFLGYPDPRPHRTFANIRYALYEYWIQYYTEQSYILILDFRDTFFQANPFSSFGKIENREIKYDLHLFQENALVKQIGICKYNSLWIGRCFGKPALQELKQYPVICSGSTLGSYPAITHYVRTMLKSMDDVKCWLKGIESDQGYQNYLYYNGYFNVTGGTTRSFGQGEGIVNTIGAMNGKRVPAEMKGPLDTFWKARDDEGFIINYDGTRSACVHQWDRWYKDLHKFIDAKTF